MNSHVVKDVLNTLLRTSKSAAAVVLTTWLLAAGTRAQCGTPILDGWGSASIDYYCQSFSWFCGCTPYWQNVPWTASLTGTVTLHPLTQNTFVSGPATCVAGQTYQISLTTLAQCTSANCGGSYCWSCGCSDIVMFSAYVSPYSLAGECCDFPLIINGTGTFPFDTAGYSTDSVGQGDALCQEYGYTGIRDDVWYRWAYPGNGPAEVTLSLCGTSSGNSKVAVRKGADCNAVLVACDDDSYCGAGAVVTFPAAVGETFLFQIGNSPASAPAPSAAGNFSICYTGVLTDCNANGLRDSCEMGLGITPDCNQNLVPDSCDIATGTSQDVNVDGIPDECQAPHCILATMAPPDPGLDDRIGYYVATDGDRVLVGSNIDDGPAGADQGSAYVYRRDGVALTLEQKLVANDAAADDRFGVNGLAIQGDWAVIGAYRADAPGSNSGAVYVFKRNPATGVWAQNAKFVASDTNADDYFGYGIHWSGNLLFVGAITKETPVGTDRGKVYVFQWSGTAFTQVASMYAPDGVAFDLFGSALDYENGRLAVGANAADTSAGIDSGAVYVFKQTGSNWALEQKLEGHYSGARGGTSTSIEGDLIALGQPLDPILGPSAGWVTIWKRDPATSVWSLTWNIVEPDTDSVDEFGRSVRFVGNKLFIGAPFNAESSGSGTVYCRTFLGSSWTVADRVHPGAGIDAFGVALDWAGGLLAVGAYATPTGGVSGAGATVAVGTLGFDCNQNFKCDFCDIQAGAPDGNVNGVIDACEIIQFCFCPAPLGPCGNNSPTGGCLNSNGTSATMTWVGSNSVSADNLVLVTAGMPPGKSAIMFMGANPTSSPVAMGDGRRCVSPPTLRWPLSTSSVFGVAAYGPGLSTQSLQRFGPNGHLAPGSTWRFQSWYRDPTGPCGQLTNLSSGIKVTFTP